MQGFAVKGKRKGGTAILRPLSWSERLALELEEIWGTLEDGVSLLYQVCSMPAKPLRRWRRQTTRVASHHFKGLSDKAYAAVASARETISAVLPQQQDRKPEQGVAASRSVRKGGQQSERHDEVENQQQQQQQRFREQQAQEARATHEEANDEASACQGTDAEVTDAAAASLEVAQVDQSPQAADSVQGTKQTDEAVRRRRRPKKKGGGEQSPANNEEGSGKVAPAALEEAVEPDAQHDRQEEEEQEDDIGADGKIMRSWDPLSDLTYERRCHVQHARLLMLLSNTRHNALKVDKRSLAANWLIAYYVTPANKMAYTEEAEPEEAGPTGRKGKKKKRPGMKNDAGHEAMQEDEKADSGWDPLGNRCDSKEEVTEKHPGSFQHARLLMLLSNARHSGAPYCKRTLAATWLTVFHMPDAHRCILSPKAS